MFTRLCTVLLALLLAAPITHAITFRAKFNPGGWLSGGDSVDYWFTVDASDPISVGGPDTQGLAINLGTFPLDGATVTTSGPSGSDLTGTLVPGPPQNLSLTKPSIAVPGDFQIGDSIHINSGPNPSSVVGVGVDVTWSLRTVGGTLTPFSITQTALPPVGPTIGPAFVAAPQVGDAVLSGTGDPGTYVWLFQDNPLLPPNGGPLDPDILLGFGQVDPSGNFAVALESPLTEELLSVGVSETLDNIFEGGEIVQFIQPVPEPGSAVTACLVCAMLAYGRYRAR